jgi:predicted CXXCH cytochrome family protein
MKRKNIQKKQINYTIFVCIIVGLVLLFFPKINIDASVSPKIFIHSPINNAQFDDQNITLSGTFMNKESAVTTTKLFIYENDTPIFSKEGLTEWSFEQKYSDGTHIIRFELLYVFEDGREEVIDSQIINFFVKGTHGDYSANTQSCGKCHTTHTAKKNHLLGEVEDKRSIKSCTDCHPSTGESNFHLHGTLDLANGENCTTCHNPHGDSKEDNPYSLWDYYEYSHDPAKSDVGYINSNEVLCESCHEKNNTVKVQWKSHYRYLTFRDFTVAQGNINEDSSLCLSCHDGSKNDTTNIKQYYENTLISSGHTINALDRNKEDFQMPCSDCHVTHGNGNIKGLKNELGHQGGKEYNEFTGSWNDTKEKAFCLTCHSDGTKMYGIDLMDLKPLASDNGHDLSSDKSCSSCHGGDDPASAAHTPMKLITTSKTETEAEISEQGERLKTQIEPPK